MINKFILFFFFLVNNGFVATHVTDDESCKALLSEAYKHALVMYIEVKSTQNGMPTILMLLHEFQEVQFY